MVGPISATLGGYDLLDRVVLYPYTIIHPIPPTNLTATYINKSKNANVLGVKLVWTDSSLDIDSYKIYRNEILLTTVAYTEKEYIDYDINGGVDYVSYYIVSVDIYGTESEPSNIVSNYSTAFMDLMERLRKMLADNPADVRMKRWTDEDLITFLDISLDDLNAEPPMTHYSYEDLLNARIDSWRSLILTRAKIEALTSRASVEIAKEFSYSFGGVNLNVQRGSKYQGLAQMMMTSYQDQLKRRKLAHLMSLITPTGIMSNPLPFKVRVYAPRQYRVR